MVVNLLVILLVAAFVAGVGWWLLQSGVDTAEVEQRVKFERVKASANHYHQRLGMYEGVCSDIGVGSNMRCLDSENAYAIETTIKTGLFYCLDSTGFMGQTRIPKGESTSCRR